jgi:hypothetical protein
LAVERQSDFDVEKSIFLLVKHQAIYGVVSFYGSDVVNFYSSGVVGFYSSGVVSFYSSGVVSFLQLWRYT